jgi:hypothetical protein
MDFAGSVGAVSILQGALVALPRGDALARLSNWRSPGWAFMLPGLIVAGTFGLVAMPGAAVPLIRATAVLTPILALCAASVVRRRIARPTLCLVLLAVVGAGLAPGLIGHLSASLVTACGAALAGAVIVALIPGRWLVVSIAVMCVADVVLMRLGVGQMSSQLLDSATRDFHGPTFDAANVGMLVTEYPDLLLAAVIGAVSAGRPGQRSIAILVVVCVAAYDLLLLDFTAIPATPPLGLALALFWAYSTSRRWRRRRRGAGAAPSVDGLSVGRWASLISQPSPAASPSSKANASVRPLRRARWRTTLAGRRTSVRATEVSSVTRSGSSCEPATRTRAPLTEMSMTTQSRDSPVASIRPAPRWSMRKASRRISTIAPCDRTGPARLDPAARTTSARREPPVRRLDLRQLRRRCPRE